MSQKHTACQKKFGMLDHVSWKHRARQKKDAALWDTRPCPQNTKLVRRKLQQLSTIDHVFQKHKVCLKEAAAIQDNRLCVSRLCVSLRTIDCVSLKHTACQKNASGIWDAWPCVLKKQSFSQESCSNSGQQSVCSKNTKLVRSKLQ